MPTVDCILYYKGGEDLVSTLYLLYWINGIPDTELYFSDFVILKMISN